MTLKETPNEALDESLAMTAPVGKPELATNRAGQTVAGVVSEFVRNAAGAYVGGAHLDIATAYFNLEGYDLLADALDQLNGVRMLLGAEPTPPENKKRRLGVESSVVARAARKRLNEALAKHEHAILDDWQLLRFAEETNASAKRLVDWLRSGKVEVRRLNDRFLHGKAFIIGTQTHGLLAGSSNFTRAGLTTNLELNIGNYTPHTVTQVQEWFEELWEAAEPYDLAARFEKRYEPHPPYLIYLRMLWELYGDELKKEAEEDFDGVPRIHLTSFQTDGVWRAKRFLAQHNGVLIADEVGLGKTYIAGELIREAALERRQRVLVVAPATLRDGPWKAFQGSSNLPFELVSFDDLAADERLNPRRARTHKLNVSDVNEYAMVVVDEAHNLRNPSTQRAEALRRLLAKAPPKQLVLVTATPVNNSLWDLYHLLGYFLRNDAVFATAGIRSLRDHFMQAMQLSVDELSPEHLFDVLDATAVRRTRSFVKSYYPGATIKVDGEEQTITFPTPRVRKVTYDLDDVLPGFFGRLAAALDPENPDAPGALTLARYMPSRYRLDAEVESYELQLAGLMRSWLLKRFESSPYAFACTCRRMAKSYDAFLSLLEQHDRVATGEALADWLTTDSDDEEAVDQYMDANVSLSEPADLYDAASLAADAARDRDMLLAFAAEASEVERADDPNLAALIEELADIAAEAELEGIGDSDVRNKRKVLIFSYYADTVEWIYDYLLEAAASDSRLSCYEGRIAWLSGSSGGSNGDGALGGKKLILYGFAPRTTGAPRGYDDRYDVVVTTDVLSEGVNLQQARHIINYDLPWNPMRLVQRHGRIDRIGSLHSEVFIRCVFPDALLDKLLGLEERLQQKIAQAAASIGVGEVLPGQASVNINYSETREEIERLRNEDAGIFERGGTGRGVLSGEEYRQELRKALENSQLAEQIEELQWGSGSGMRAGEAATGAGGGGARGGDARGGGGTARADAGVADGGGLGGTTRACGYVFCVRVGDREQPLFRYVKYPGAPSAGALSREALSSGASSPGSSPPGVLSPGATLSGASSPGVLSPEASALGEGMNFGYGSGAVSKEPPVGFAAPPSVVDETLICLDHAHPPKGFATPRVLSEQVAAGVFAAWEVARVDVVEKWNFLADKANLEPKLPRELERAAEILRSHAPTKLTRDELDRALDTICAPYPERTIRTFRVARKSSDDPGEQAEAILGVIEELGLQPYAAPEPLPEITEDDVYLVCWLALS